MAEPMTPYRLKSFHQEVLEDFDTKRIDASERDKRFKLLWQKAQEMGLRYEIDPSLVPKPVEPPPLTTNNYDHLKYWYSLDDNNWWSVSVSGSGSTISTPEPVAENTHISNEVNENDDDDDEDDDDEDDDDDE